MARRSESDDDRGVGGQAAGACTISSTRSTSDRVDELYRLSPGDFTAARNALARELRSEGHRDEAAQVAKLRRPTVAAWAINQAVRGHRDRFTALLDAGQQVRRAQRRALSGVRDSGLREATRARRELIDELTHLAVQILAEQGSSAESHRGDIAATFDAASGDDDAAEAVAAARLAAPLPVASDFGGMDGLAVLPPPETPEPPRTPEGAPAAARPDDAERERAAQRRREVIRAVEAARREVADAETAAAAAEEEALARAAAADDAARAAREAEVQWRRLKLEADSLQPKVAQARAHADRARRTVERRMAQLLERERELAEWPLDDEEG